MNLQELADMPGAGCAETALKRAGKWDEYAGLPYKMYSVEVTGTAIINETYAIRARSIEEADALACKKFDAEYDGDIDDLEVTEL